jgi:tetratricopeptide (TPR) repeat protein
MIPRMFKISCRQDIIHRIVRGKGQEADMAKCAKCGATLRKGAEFCGKCGTKTAAAVKEEEAEKHFDRAGIYCRVNDYDSAIAEYTEAIRLNPDYATAFNNRGHVYNRKGDYDHAIADYTEAIRLNPDDAKAFRNRGYTYNEKGDYDHAIADCTEAIRLDPDDAKAFRNRGYAYNGKGDYDHAIADCTEAIRLNPDYAKYKEALKEAKKN